MSELHIRLGKALQGERQAKNITIADIAANLKTTESTLERIEEGDLASFQSPVYFALHAKSYAEFLGVDYLRTMEAIREDLGELNDVSANGVAAPNGVPPVTVAPPVEAEDRTKNNRLLIIGLGLIFVLAAALGTWWIVSSQSGPDAATQIEKEQTATDATPVAMDTTAGAPAGDSVALRLNLVARGSSWVSLIADGDSAYSRTFAPGDSLELEARRQFIFTISSPANIDLKLNGYPAKLTDRSGRVSNVVVTPANVRAFTGGAPAPVQPDTATGENIDGSTTAPESTSVSGDSGR
ncbi:MAG: DUF4115 domain-containing protein [candidate division Zixibacteria bacterium]|nr:DUF4115 domain-containing protein [candidate division Zixibacteria bacterium]